MLPRVKEEQVVVLDFLPNGYPSDYRPMHMKTPIAQAIGKTHFVILELVPKKGVFLRPNHEVYVGEGKREKIHHIVGRIQFEKLTQTAKMNLEVVVKEMVKKHEKEYIKFFNTAQPINTRMHKMELVPGIGKKHMWEIIEEREKKPFEDFSDLKARVKLMPDPEKSIVKRIMVEIRGEDRYKLFVG